MKQYDEKYFRAKANRRAGTTWVMLMLIVTVYYGAKMASGDVKLEIRGFEPVGNAVIDGCIIRSSNNAGEYIIGCRMPEDNEAIRDYVSQNYSE